MSICLTTPRIMRYFFAFRDAIGVCVVSSPQEYHANAVECFGWARAARTEKARELFIRMARTWLEAAACARTKVQSPDLAPK
jgi:hypothetical protein